MLFRFSSPYGLIILVMIYFHGKVAVPLCESHWVAIDPILWSIQIIFFQIAKCICPNRMYLSKLWYVFHRKAAVPLRKPLSGDWPNSLLNSSSSPSLLGLTIDVGPKLDSSWIEDKNTCRVLFIVKGIAPRDKAIGQKKKERFTFSLGEKYCKHSGKNADEEVFYLDRELDDHVMIFALV